ncbi:MAG: hypothetical protein WC346_03920 [Methanogenium sp.]|jgi:hypothetical protein
MATIRFEDIFVLKDGIVELVSSRETLIPEIREIIRRDRGQHKVKGDPDGRQKKYAFLELTAVYYIADYRSPGRKQGLENMELLEYAKDRLCPMGLPITWIPDELVLKLIDYYEDNVSNGVAAKLVNSLYNTFHLSIQVIDTIRQDFKNKLNNINEVTDSEKKDMLVEIQSMLSLSTNLSKQLSELKSAEATLRKEEESKKLSRGDKPVTSSMDPDDDD